MFAHQHSPSTHRPIVGFVAILMIAFAVSCGSDSASDPIVNQSIVDQPPGGHLFGRITDSQTNEPIPNAFITLLNTQHRVNADADE